MMMMMVHPQQQQVSSSWKVHLLLVWTIIALSVQVSFVCGFQPTTRVVWTTTASRLPASHDELSLQPRRPVAALRMAKADTTQQDETKAVDTKTKDDDNDDGPCPCAYVEDCPYADGTKPDSAIVLAVKNFIRQGSCIAQETLATIGITPPNYIPNEERPPDCLGLTLDNDKVKEAELQREAVASQKVNTNPASRLLYDIGCFALDELFPGRPIARFWFLEIIARIPYFSYVSMLHLYESFGWWRQPELRKIHYAEEYNELHHLLIMESLGGNRRWRDRFLGYHVAFGYYWAVNALFFFSPKAAYEFMELLESHAVDTYSTFYKENAERLQKLPAPKVAVSYYKADDPYMFDDFQVSKKPKTRKPPCENLYDVFKNICEDEGEHVKTMKACKEYSSQQNGENGERMMVVSPHYYDYETSKRDAEIDQQTRQAWIRWSEEINNQQSELDP